MVTAEMLALLDALGANEPRGTGRPLLDHLEGVRALLAAWGSPSAVCLAGLFHSAYGAEGGNARTRDANLARRDDVRALIGPVAEELAYLYSALERRHLFGNAARRGNYTVREAPMTLLRRKQSLRIFVQFGMRLTWFPAVERSPNATATTEG